jgi:hypothetical protein
MFFVAAVLTILSGSSMRRAITKSARWYSDVPIWLPVLR